MVELAFPDHLDLLRELGGILQLQPAGMPAFSADLERRIGELSARPLEREPELALFCLLCYEAFGCEGTWSRRTRERIDRDPYALGSSHTLSDGTLVRISVGPFVHPDYREVREVGGSRRRWLLGHESVLTPCSEEMVGLKLRSLSFEGIEAEAMAWANRLLDRLRSQPSGAGELYREAAEILAQLSGPITPEDPELERIVQALRWRCQQAHPDGEFQEFEIWQDYGLMRWARKSGYL